MSRLRLRFDQHDTALADKVDLLQDDHLELIVDRQALAMDAVDGCGQRGGKLAGRGFDDG